MNKCYIEKHSEGGGRWYSYRCINAEHFYGRCTYHFQWVLGIEIPWWWAGFSRKKQTLNLKLTYSIFRTLIFGNFGCLSGRGNGPIQNTIFSSKHLMAKMSNLKTCPAVWGWEGNQVPNLVLASWKFNKPCFLWITFYHPPTKINSTQEEGELRIRLP